MRKRGLLAATGALVAVGLAMSGAAAPPTPGAELPVSALDSVIETGELPADVTGEPGEWNFAGPASACPGPGWNCTTVGDGPVVQTGAVNIAQCVGIDCVGITQVGDVNKIECAPPEEKTNPTAVQECGPFNQGGDHNIAIFKLIYDVNQGSTQCVLQKGEITQEGVTNYFKAQFTAKMTTTTGLTQTQDARQRLVVNQTADERNESEIQEVQVQDATGNATTQNQNTSCPVNPPGAVVDCNPASLGPATPYACLNLTQRAAPGGENLSKLKQEVKQDAQTTATTATETQGTATGGNDARVHQEVGEVVEVPDEDLFVAVAEVFVPSATGKNVGLADQYTYQTLPDRALLAQSQYEDPFCCGGSQLGGDPDAGGEETSKAWVQQEANRNALQIAEATGVTASSSGECTVTHNLDNNGGTVQTSQADGPPCAVTGTSACTGSVEGSCTSTNCSEDEFFNPETGRCEDEPTITLTAPSLAGARAT
jgi:hypothetical protein